jgi:SAM-dependent methyltransferase
MGRAKTTAKAVLPRRATQPLGRLVRELQAIRATPRRLEQLETLALESHERLRERSRGRWVEAPPDVGLTFDRALTGDAFVAKAAAYGAFGPGRTVLEVGPGYGRILEAALRAGAGFDRWIGVDLSPHNVAHLIDRFDLGDRVRFVNADAETVEIGEPIDTFVSSLTLKHVYPSFEGVLRNVAGSMRDGGRIVIDLYEGRRRYFEEDGLTYIRWYTRDEVEAIFESSGCEVEAFDTVEHDPDHRRLLVVGRPARAG